MKHAFVECDVATALTAAVNLKALITGLRQTMELQPVESEWHLMSDVWLGTLGLI